MRKRDRERDRQSGKVVECWTQSWNGYFGKVGKRKRDVCAEPVTNYLNFIFSQFLMFQRSLSCTSCLTVVWGRAYEHMLKPVSRMRIVQNGSACLSISLSFSRCKQSLYLLLSAQFPFPGSSRSKQTLSHRPCAWY